MIVSPRSEGCKELVSLFLGLAEPLQPWLVMSETGDHPGDEYLQAASPRTDF